MSDKLSIPEGKKPIKCRECGDWSFVDKYQYEDICETCTAKDRERRMANTVIAQSVLLGTVVGSRINSSHVDLIYADGKEITIVNYEFNAEDMMIVQNNNMESEKEYYSWDLFTHDEEENELAEAR